MAKQRITFRINTALIDRLNERRYREGRSQNALIEQALAEFLNVPLANRDLPEQPVEICANCQRGVLNEGRCGDCGWHRLTRQQQWAHDRQIRAAKERDSKYAKRAKEVA